MQKTKQNNFENELEQITPIINQLGFSLDTFQPHISGEKKLMRAVTTASGQKLILIGHQEKGNKKVIIKITKDKKGVHEIEKERICRDALKNIIFAYKIFFSPKEILFTKIEGYTISIQEYINQESTFLERPIEKQFSLALKVFKAQEGAHATTYRHKKIISKTFGYVDSDWYIKSYQEFKNNIGEASPENKKLQETLQDGEMSLIKNKEIIEQYCGFLTHTDFVPHNFRVVNNDIYLLDHSSIRFGNKYEGWARFLNFMTLHNRPLEEALLFYIKNNRTKEEQISLKLMRIYRLGEIIWYYTNLLQKTSGDLQTLTNERIKFWGAVLESILKDQTISEEAVNKYKELRDSLRSDEEKQRQKNLH